MRGCRHIVVLVAVSAVLKQVHPQAVIASLDVLVLGDAAVLPHSAVIVRRSPGIVECRIVAPVVPGAMQICRWLPGR